MSQSDRRLRTSSTVVNYSESQHRRSNKEVEEERQSKKRDLSRKLAERKEGESEVAAIEAAARKKAAQQKHKRGVDDDDDDEPRMKKVERKRPAQHDGPKGNASKKQRVENINVPYGKKIAKVIYAVNDEQEDPFDGGEDPLSIEKFEALMREVGDGDSGSEDEYAPKGNSGDEDEDDDEGGELEDDEDDAQLEKRNKKNKKGEKKERAGVSARRRIRELQLPDGNDETPTRTTKKPSAKATAKHHRDGGLKPNWKQQDVLLPPPIKKARTEPTEDDEDGPMQQFGSLIGDDEDPEPERAGLALMESSMSIPTNAKISKLESSSRYANKPKPGGSSSNNSSPGTGRATVNKLPDPGRTNWKIMKVLGINEVSGEQPWKELSDEKIEQIWNESVDEVNEVSVDKQNKEEHALLRDVRTLMNGQVIPTEWRFKIQERAKQVLEGEFELRGLDKDSDSDERAELVTILLGGGGDMLTDRDDVNKPFVWLQAYQAGFKTGDKYKLKDGIFMSPLILKTLAVHYEILASLPEEQLCKRPYGALCTVVQAVHRALEYSLSGAFAQPPGKTGHFSEENWGDYVRQRVDKDGKTIRKSVRRATVFLPTMKSLTDGQWERIVSGAQAFRTTKKEASRTPRIISAGVEEPDDVVLSWD